MNRAGRRRLAQDGKLKDQQQEQALNLEAIQKELEAEITVSDADTNSSDNFLTRLAMYQQFESQKNTAREWFQLLTDLHKPKPIPEPDKSNWLQRFGDARRSQELMMPKLFDALQKARPEDRDALLTKRFIVAAGGGLVECPKGLAERLRAMLHKAEKRLQKQPA